MRADALRCLRLLVQAVGDGDALAFFIPGLVSGLGAALISAGKRPDTSCLHSCRLVPQLPALPARPLAGLMAARGASWLPRTPRQVAILPCCRCGPGHPDPLRPRRTLSGRSRGGGGDGGSAAAGAV